MTSIKQVKSFDLDAWNDYFVRVSYFQRFYNSELNWKHWSQYLLHYIYEPKKFLVVASKNIKTISELQGSKLVQAF